MNNDMIKNMYKSLEPEVGMGATELLYSDRHAFTIIGVVNETTIRLQADIAVRSDSNGMSDAQSYNYTPNPKGNIVTAYLSPDGHWLRERFTVQKKSYDGTVFMLGRRDEYHDYGY